MRIEAAISPPVEKNPTALADWAEAIMLIEGAEEVSATELRGRLKEEGEPDEESDELTPANAQDELAPYDDLDLYQTDVEALLSEVEIRQQIAPTIYPFRRTEVGIARLKPDQPLYEFLLMLSLVNVPFRKESYSANTSRLFDFLTLAALQSKFSGGRAVRFGAPPQGDRPGGIKKGLAWLAGELGLPLNKDVPAGRFGGDGGVDVVAWRGFRDRRSGFVMLLAQCTIAVDTEKKAKDIEEKLWRDYFTLRWEPLTALVVPYCISTDEVERWKALGYPVAMVIDRMRLCELLEHTEAVAIPGLEEILAWTRSKREELAIAYNDAA